MVPMPWQLIIVHLYFCVKMKWHLLYHEGIEMTLLSREYGNLDYFGSANCCNENKVHKHVHVEIE